MLADKRAATTTGGAGGTTGGAAGASAAGDATGGDDGEAGESSSSSSGQGEGGATMGGDESAESQPQGEDGDAGSSRVPPDIPDSRGDDVVARQLREAATSEPDPELREKLWDEYRRYKGISVKKTDTPKEKDDDTKAKEGGGESSTG